MPSFEETLDRLGAMFTVRDIMVNSRDLTKGHDEVSARKSLEDNPDFDVTPIERRGRLSAYLVRGSQGVEAIRLKDVIGDATSLLDMVDVLRERKFCFVVTKDRVESYVHFSDLNKGIVKLPFFVLFESLEHNLAERISSLVDESNLDVVLGQNRATDVRRRFRRQKKGKADLRLVNALGFGDIIKYASHCDKLDLSPKQIEKLVNVRNRVSHATLSLIEKHGDVRRLSESKGICLSVLSSNDDM